jgi:predicted RNA-binding Zn-ribbon protein involved in translation (DUF1610 family)
MLKYKLTKAIRFKLNAEHAPSLTAKAESLQAAEPEGQPASLVNEGYNLANIFEKYIFSDKEKKKLSPSVTIHFRWLRQHTRYAFYEWKGEDTLKDKKPKLADVPYLPEKLAGLLSEWRNTLETLNIAANAPKESNTRKANMGLAIRKLGTRSMFPFIESFIKDSNPKDSDELKSQILQAIDRFKTLLNECEYWSMTSQSSGLEIARASFNYYTINKKPKDFNKEREKVEKNLSALPQEIRLSAIPGYKLFIKYNEEGNQYVIKLKMNDKELWETVNLKSLYKGLKHFKSEQKSAFAQAITQGLEYEKSERFPLFYGYPDAFNRYVELTNKIQKKAEKKNNAKKDSEEAKKLGEEISRLKQKRGKLFFDEQNKSGEPKERFEKYVSFCSVFKDVAIKRGQLIARLKGIEKEEIDSQRLQYWAVITEKNGRHQVALIPKQNAQKAYKQIREWREQPGGSVIVYYFDSLTYRSLKKLCFGINGNTFLPEVKEELTKQIQWNYPEGDFGEHTFKNNDSSRDEQALIAFYQKVLSTSFVKQNLTLPPNFAREVLNKDFDTEQDFRIALEKCCYVRHKKISGEQLERFLHNNNAEVFSITSFDLERLDRKKDEQRKAHTRLWLDFWKPENENEKFPLRLNPEITVTWREPKKSRMEKYGEGTPLYDPGKKNRYLHPQFTLVTTFNENALAPEINYAFQNAKQKGEAIISFNKQVNAALKSKYENDNLWFYGIDTGKVELATMCLMDKNKKLQPFSVLELREGKLDYEKTGYLKEGTQKSYKAVKNLSYFLNPELYEKTFRDVNFQKTFDELFLKKEVPAIDLSKAKVISGHIVLNGDIAGYEKLNTLSNMRQEQREQTITLDKINHVRRLIAGNMVGVISHLYKNFPGYLLLEDNAQSWIEDERLKFEGRVERPLEWALYRKFQGYGLTPPLSELVRLREQEKFKISNGSQPRFATIKQFGVLILVNKEGTSLHCPNCGKKAYQNDNEIMPDKSQKIFQCKHCGYHNRNNPLGLDGLNSNDKVAANNIAKRGLEKFLKEI